MRTTDIRTVVPPSFASLAARCKAVRVTLTYERKNKGSALGYRLRSLRPPLLLYLARSRDVERWLWEREHGPISNIADVIQFRLAHG